MAASGPILLRYGKWTPPTAGHSSGATNTVGRGAARPNSCPARTGFATSKETVQQLRDEIAILKGQKPRPQIAPSRLEQPAPRSPLPRATNARVCKTSEERAAHHYPRNPHSLPGPARRVGFQGLRSLHRPRIGDSCGGHALPPRAHRDGRRQTLLAPLPADVLPGQTFGPNPSVMSAPVPPQPRHPAVVAGRIAQRGILISAGQINHILTEGKGVFHSREGELLPAGLAGAPYLRWTTPVPGTRARNGYGPPLSATSFFAYFASTDSKSRLNFLTVLRGAHRDYVINEVAVAYWQKYELAAGTDRVRWPKGRRASSMRRHGTHACKGWRYRGAAAAHSPPKERCWEVSLRTACGGTAGAQRWRGPV